MLTCLEATAGGKWEWLLDVQGGETSQTCLSDAAA